MPERSDTWTLLRPHAESAEAASRGLGLIFRRRIDAILESYFDELSKVPESHRSDLSVQGAIFEEVIGRVRDDLEDRFREMDQCLKQEIRSRLEVEKQQRIEAAFNRLGSAILEGRPFAELSQIVSEECTGLLACQATFVFVTGADGAIDRGKGFETSNFSTAEVVIVPVVEQVIRSRRPHFAEDPMGPAPAMMAGRASGPWAIRNLVAFPVVLGDRVLGVIVSINKDDGFSERDTEALGRVASHVGLVFQRYEVQDGILRMKRFYEQLVTHAGQGIVSVDSGEITSWNDGAARIFGRPSSAVIGKRLEALLEEGEAPRLRGHLEEISRSRRSVTFEAIGSHEDGRRLDLAITLSPLPGRGGVVGIISDLSDRKRLQQQLIQSEKMAAVGQLISGIAHELNNPLAAVIGFSELILEAGEVSEGLKGDLRTIHGNANRCRDIVGKLLRFARKEATQFASYDIEGVLRDAIALREREMGLRGVTVALHRRGRPGELVGNAGQIQQVVLNLLNNAFDAVLDAGGRGSIEVVLEATPSGAIIEIRDDGPGVPDEFRERIFDPFFTTKTAGKGTGLGLSVSYRIVANHGGRIEALDREGGGACFRVTLPSNFLASLPSLEDGEIPATGGESLEGKRVLVVDDEEDICALIDRALAGRCAGVDAVSNGEEAIAAVDRARYDLVVVDVILPGAMDGFRAAREIVRRQRHLDGRVIFTTGETVNPIVLDRIDETGAVFLAKPFGAAEVVEAAGDVLAAPGRVPTCP